jgi:hypothetical protein
VISWCSEEIRAVLQALIEEDARRVAVRTHSWHTDARGAPICTLEAYIVFKKPRRLSSFQSKPWNQLKVEHWLPSRFCDWPHSESDPACGYDMDFGKDTSRAAPAKRPRAESPTRAPASGRTLLRSVLKSGVERDLDDACSVTSSADRSSLTSGEDSPPAQRAPPAPLERECAILDAALLSMSEDPDGLPRGFYSAPASMEPGGLAPGARAPPPRAEPDLLERFGLTDMGWSAHVPSCWTLPLALGLD